MPFQAQFCQISSQLRNGSISASSLYLWVTCDVDFFPFMDEYLEGELGLGQVSESILQQAAAGQDINHQFTICFRL